MFKLIFVEVWSAVIVRKMGFDLCVPNA